MIELRQISTFIIKSNADIIVDPYILGTLQWSGNIGNLILPLADIFTLVSIQW